AVAKMAGAIKNISTEKGYDLSLYTLASFGGAGGQHACQIANQLGIKKIIIHPLAGVLSAFGIGASNLRTIQTESVELPLTEENIRILSSRFEHLTKMCQEKLVHQSANTKEHTLVTVGKIAIRYFGTDYAIATQFGSAAEIESEFKKIHLERFGFLMES